MSSKVKTGTELAINQSISEEIDLSKLISTLLDNIWLIIGITIIFSSAGIAYAVLATPIYKADALLQVESKSSGMTAFVGDMGDMFANDSSSSTEVEIIKSRMNLGKTVDKYNMTVKVMPKTLPIIGKGLDRVLAQTKQIKVSRYDVSKQYPSNSVALKYNGVLGLGVKGFTIMDINSDEVILKGKVGELASNEYITIFVQSIDAKPDDVFIITKKSRFNAIQTLQSGLTVKEKGNQSGILLLSFTGENRQLIELILNDISQNYFLQNVLRNSAEAEKSLSFLQKHLPNIKSKLTVSEDSLNKFRQENESIDLSMEAQSALKLMVSLESQLNELTLKESEVAKRFTKDHPTYKALLDKRAVLLSNQKELNHEVKKLPKTQRDVLRIKRDVEVNQQIYVQLLNKVQELNILKAGTVGNVRILDRAQSYSSAIKPKKAIIFIIATFLGLIFSILIVLLKSFLHKGVEDPDEIEALGISVYASVPMSNFQTGMDIKVKRKKGIKSKKKSGTIKLGLHETLLAVANPADLSIEALRGLRTSMHFAMMEAKNSVVMISGPAPGIGKSFVSVNFAAVMAKTGQKVLLVDADMRKGYLHQHFNLHWLDGLSEMLSGKLSVSEVIKKSEIDNLDVITRGQIPPNPSELLMHARFSEFIDWASKEYDLILIDTPPVLAVTDPSIVGALAGTTLMVGRYGKNTAKEIDVARHRFAMAGVEVKGFILNAVEKKASSSYGYGYYNYSYESDK